MIEPPGPQPVYPELPATAPDLGAGAPPPAMYGPPLPHAPSRLRPWHIAVAVVVAAVLGFGGGAAGVWGLARLGGAVIQGQAPGAGGGDLGLPQLPDFGSSASGGTLDAQGLATRVDPAVVDINTVVAGAAGSTQASGTGLVLTSSGEVLTNNHVVEGATEISVVVTGRSGSYSAQVLGVDPSADIALIKVKGVSGLPTVSLADSSTLQVGAAVAAIGNAGGQGGTPALTQGTITGLDQTITASDFGNNAEQLTGMIETNATIQPGDSGGALVDSSGKVVGVITTGQVRRFRFRAGAAGLGYAIPTNSAMSIVKDIRAGKSSATIFIGEPGYMGVTVAALDAGTASSLGLSAGVLIESVQAGSPAEKAGISAGSVVTSVNSTAVDSVDSLGAIVHAHHPGTRVSVTWVDGGGRHTASVTLTTGPAV